MAWVCPTCSRSFKIKNQSHSCLVRDASHHFSNKSPEIKAIFDKITGILDNHGPVQISYVENAILISATSTFLAVKPKKDHVAIEFLLDQEIIEFPIYKTFRVSRNKVAHFVKLGSEEEVDGLLGRWIGEAYRVNLGKGDDRGRRSEVGGRKTDDR